MFLSKIELIGFKSFANKTVLNFDSGITAVVGPNGCGKTNIVDAIRWVLGEQKSSVLRSDKMENVIFSGSLKKKPLGFAEVSMVIENTKNILPSEYSEIMITRRLFRSGDSDYLLNKKACRLKDINNLLMDSGIAADAYSVIELNMVEMLLDDRNDFRRRLFEEASGITKYKVRRNETVRKLDSTSIDLIRVNDIISEVDLNVQRLKKQVTRAIRYDKIKQQLKENEKIYYNVKRRRLIDQVKPFEDIIDKYNLQLHKLSGQLTKKEAVIEQAKTEILDNQKIVANAQGILNKFSDKVREKDNTYAKLQERSESLRSSERRREEEISNLETKIKDAGNQIREVARQIELKANELETADKKLVELKFEREKFFSDYQSKKTMYLGKSQQVIDVMNKLSEKVRGRDKIVRDNQERQERLEKLIEARKSSDKKLMELSNNLKILKEDETRLATQLEEKRIAKESKLKRREELSEKITELEKNINKDKVTLESLRTKHEFLCSLVEEHGGLPGGVSALLKAKSEMPGLLGTIGELITVPKEFRLAVEAALGDQANFVVFKTANNVKYALEYLKKSNLGRATLAALDRIPGVPVNDKNQNQGTFKNRLIDKFKYPDNIKNLIHILLKDVFVEDNIDINEETLKNFTGDSLRVVNLNGDMNSVGFAMTGGSAAEETTGVVGRKDRIEELNNEISRLESGIQKNEKMVEEDEKKRSDISSGIDQLSAEGDSINNELESVKRKLGIIQFDFDQTSKQIEEMATETEQLELFKQASRDFEGLNEEIKEYEKHLETLQKERAVFQEKEKALEQERQDIENKFSDQNYLVIGIKSRLENFDQEKNMLLGRQSEYSKDINKNKIDLEEIIKQKKATSKRASDMENELEKLFEEQRSLENNVFKSNEELNRIQESKQKDFDSYLDLQKQINELNENLQREKDKLTENRQELRVLEEMVTQKNIQIEEIDDSALKMEIDELYDSIHKLNFKIEQFGPVNMEAVEEYNKEHERFEFLQNQANDLEEAKVTLEDTIKKINDVARERFLETFEKVRENFKNIFRSFFENGEANISIDEDEDPLDSRIDVFAQPHGKKVQLISMLSGGEKALTAIAILFAIYMVKPSPFCLLDEVDAPLDDSNISRFIKMLQQFTTNTQFIVVTHNKKTMEAATNLYGVTMEESGVSKLVSVRINKQDVSTDKKELELVE